MGSQDPLNLHGRVWKYGDRMSLYDFLSPEHDAAGVAGRYAELVPYLLEGVDSAFVENVRPGDVIVAGANFGLGKHHGAVIGVLKEVGITAILARSVDTLFQREAIDMGFPALGYPEIVGQVENGDIIQFHLRTGAGKNETRGCAMNARPCAAVICDILVAGGVKPYTLARLGKVASAGVMESVA